MFAEGYRTVGEAHHVTVVRFWEARDYASHIDSKIILIDGKELAQYMIDHNIGVAPVASYEVKRVDFDYFGEE